jgi:hypothetical protein
MEKEDENYFLSRLTQRDERWDEEDEESSLLSGLVKMEADEKEEKETFSRVMAREEVSDLLSREMVSDHLHLYGAKTHSPPHPPRRPGDQA